MFSGRFFYNRLPLYFPLLPNFISEYPHIGNILVVLWGISFSLICSVIIRGITRIFKNITEYLVTSIDK